MGWRDKLVAKIEKKPLTKNPKNPKNLSGEGVSRVNRVNSIGLKNNFESENASENQSIQAKNAGSLAKNDSGKALFRVLPKNPKNPKNLKNGFDGAIQTTLPLSEAEYAREERLAIQAESIEAENGRIITRQVDSKVLGRVVEMVLDRDNPDNVIFDGVPYTMDEMRRLKKLDKESLRSAHELKREFGGNVLSPEQAAQIDVAGRC